MAKSRIPRDVTPRETFDPQLGRREVFEIDRSNMVFQLQALRRAINESAEELRMVGIEAVFVKSISQALTRAARKLQLLAKDLDSLLHQVERTDRPKASVRSDPKPKPRKRLKKRT